MKDFNDVYRKRPELDEVLSEMLWGKFIKQIEADTFAGDQNKKQKNLYGSVDYHKKIFQEICKDYDLIWKEALSTLLDIYQNYDCDSDAHKYNTGCRCCISADVVNMVSDKFAKK